MIPRSPTRSSRQVTWIESAPSLGLTKILPFKYPAKCSFPGRCRLLALPKTALLLHGEMFVQEHTTVREVGRYFCRTNFPLLPCRKLPFFLHSLPKTLHDDKWMRQFLLIQA
ncbi:hypothetical protein J6590_060021 [Homalodisca vitripennis]|nr:hypothetical protein J6590_060021 [Homalodisca vitripennis]